MATHTLTSDLHPKTVDRIHRLRVETLRKQGRYRDLVLWMLGGEEPSQPEANGVFQTRVIRSRPKIAPTREDLIAAYDESTDPVPAPIIDYIVAHYLKGLPLKPGTKTSARSTSDDDEVFVFFAHALVEAFDAHDADGTPATRDIKTQAKDRTSIKFGYSVRTIEDIIASRRLLKSPSK